MSKDGESNNPVILTIQHNCNQKIVKHALQWIDDITSDEDTLSNLALYFAGTDDSLTVREICEVRDFLKALANSKL